MVLTTPDKMAWLTPDELRSMYVTMPAKPALPAVAQPAADKPTEVTKPTVPVRSGELVRQPDAPPAPRSDIVAPKGDWPIHRVPTQTIHPLQGSLRQRVVLHEEDPSDGSGKKYIGSAIWRAVMVSPGGWQPSELAIRGAVMVLPGGWQPSELAIRADVEIPERRITMTVSIRRNTDRALPASHTVMIEFTLPADFPFGGVSNVSGILMKEAEETRSSPLNASVAKVSSGSFLVSLSPVEPLTQHNTELLKERTWFDIPIVYNNGRRAILAIEKGAPGEKVFTEAFTTWRDKDVPANDVLKARPSDAWPAAPQPPVAPPVVWPDPSVPRIPEQPPAAPARSGHARGDWTIQLGAFSEERRARERLKEAQSMAQNLLHRAEGYTEKVVKGSRELYRARFAGLDKDGAEAACHHFKRNDIACMALRD
jgi:cell division septation protein DedD